jgi:hypothetical protein
MFLHDTVTALNGRTCVEFKVKNVSYVGIAIQVHVSEETFAPNGTG